MLEIVRQIAGDTYQQTIQELPNATTLGSDYVQNVLNVVFLLAGIIAVAVIVYAGIKYMSAQGQPDKIKTASHVIVYGVIGLVIVLISAAIVNFVVGATK